jgi:hypothetical protein
VSLLMEARELMTRRLTRPRENGDGMVERVVTLGTGAATADEERAGGERRSMARIKGRRGDLGGRRRQAKDRQADGRARKGVVSRARRPLIGCARGRRRARRRWGSRWCGRGREGGERDRETGGREMERGERDREREREEAVVMGGGDGGFDGNGK